MTLLPRTATRHPRAATRRSRAALALCLLLALLAAAPGCRHRRREILDNEALVQRARDLIAQRHFAEAVRVLGDVGLAEPVSPELDPEWKLTLADAYFYQGGTINAIEAQSRYEQFLSFHAESPKSRYARYMLGAALLRQAEDPENDQEFSIRAMTHFEAMAGDLDPADPWHRAARIMLLRAHDRLAEHEWLIAAFYLKKEKYPGAIGRLTTLLERYPGSRRRGPAFLELARAQKATGDLEQARLTLDRMLSEFPSGPLAAEAQKLRQDVAASPAGAPRPEGATGSAPGAAARSPRDGRARP